MCDQCDQLFAETIIWLKNHVFTAYITYIIYFVLVIVFLVTLVTNLITIIKISFLSVNQLFRVGNAFGNMVHVVLLLTLVLVTTWSHFWFTRK